MARMLADGGNWTPERWAAARVAQQFGPRIPAELADHARRTGHEASNFVARFHVPVGTMVDAKGVTIVSASTVEKDLRGSLKTGADIEAAKAIGKLVAERARKAGVTQVVFDRGSYLYHGRVKALAEGAREGGLDF